MTRLRVFAADDGDNPVLDTSDPKWIGDALKRIGVRYERWPLRDTAGADTDGVLAVYAPEVDRLKAAGGYKSVDIIGVAPDHPDRAALREKFLAEHRHSEDEVRFFVAGEGLFTLRSDNDRIHVVLCTAGDLISVPAGMRHWFDMGAEPSFTVIRLFENPDGWVARFTGDTIAERFPAAWTSGGVAGNGVRVIKHKPRAILLDIEGTTTSIAYVAEVLFPYARDRIPAWVPIHREELAPALAAMPPGDPVATLLGWMDVDAKETALKDIQGRIWREGYEAGELKAHVYPDTPQALKRWTEAGIIVCIYSSGSIEAQKLIFGHSEAGDLTRYLSGYFDTTTGPKREVESYTRIADALDLDPADILFVSDVSPETDAARTAGMHALLIDRDTGKGDVASFAEILP